MGLGEGAEEAGRIKRAWACGREGISISMKKESWGRHFRGSAQSVKREQSIKIGIGTRVILI
jgi:hypothetical protein